MPCSGTTPALTKPTQGGSDCDPAHIANLEGENRDTAEEHAALSALITEAGKKK